MSLSCNGLAPPICRHLASIGAENRRRQVFVRPPAVAMLLHARGPLEAPLDWLDTLVHAEFWVLSLLVEQGRSTFGVTVGI